MENLPKRLALISAGKDLTKVMELEPAIPVDSKDVEEVVTKIAEACEFITPEDTFKPGTLVVMRKLFDYNPELFSDEALKSLKQQGIHDSEEEVEETVETEEVEEVKKEAPKTGKPATKGKQAHEAPKPAKKEVADSEEEMPEMPKAQETKKDDGKKSTAKGKIYYEKSKDNPKIVIGSIVEFEPAKRLRLDTNLSGDVTKIFFEKRANKEYIQIKVDGKIYHKRPTAVILNSKK